MGEIVATRIEPLAKPVVPVKSFPKAVPVATSTYSRSYGTSIYEPYEFKVVHEVISPRNDFFDLYDKRGFQARLDRRRWELLTQERKRTSLIGETLTFNWDFLTCDLNYLMKKYDEDQKKIQRIRRMMIPVSLLGFGLGATAAFKYSKSKNKQRRR